MTKPPDLPSFPDLPTSPRPSLAERAQRPTGVSPGSLTGGPGPARAAPATRARALARTRRVDGGRVGVGALVGGARWLLSRTPESAVRGRRVPARLAGTPEERRSLTHCVPARARRTLSAGGRAWRGELRHRLSRL